MKLCQVPSGATRWDPGDLAMVPPEIWLSAVSSPAMEHLNLTFVASVVLPRKWGSIGSRPLQKPLQL
jgi:hypothetical protein